MKKIKYYILGLLLILPINVSALSVIPTITCNDRNLKAGEQTVCQFKVNVSDGKIAGISAKYSFDSTYANVSITPSGSWQGNADGGQIDYYDFQDFTGSVPIANITYKANNQINSNVESTLNINIIEVGDDLGVAHKLNTLTSVKFTLTPASSAVVTTTTSSAITTSGVSTTTTNKTTTKKITTAKKTTKKGSKTTTSSPITTTTSSATTTTSLATTSGVSTTTKKTTTTLQSEHGSSKRNVKQIIIVTISSVFLILLITGAGLTIYKEITLRNKNK
ncbi:MAG: hypothetical protein RSA10_02660 [Bacilli bacterium]